MPTTDAPTWAVVELMGHVRIAGRLTEEEKFGGKLGRLDIPTSKPCERVHVPFQDPCPDCKDTKQVDGGFVTQWFGASSVYRITAVTEDVARDIARRSSSVAPVQAWEHPKALTIGTAREDEPARYDDL